MMQPESMDVFIVACDRDFKLLRHFLLSYKVFSNIPGTIHLLIWKRDQVLLDQLDRPGNLVVHYKDDVPGLVEDDFRNQMYLKLLADKYANSEWIWVVDADFLICKPLSLDDFFTDQKPTWYFADWHGVPEKSWRKSTEAYLGGPIDHLFMDEPLYILNKNILKNLRESMDVTSMLTMKAVPSEFIAYGAHAFNNYPGHYHWVHSSNGTDAKPVFKVNQTPPSYLTLDPNVAVTALGQSKVAVFWSHWDAAEQKMHDFLQDAQIHEYGAVQFKSDTSPLRMQISPEALALHGPHAWDGCYSDGWVKQRSDFTLLSPVSGFLDIFFEGVPKGDQKPLSVTILIGAVESNHILTANKSSISIPFLSSAGGTDVSLIFQNECPETEDSGRVLYAKVHDFKLRLSEKRATYFDPMKLPEEIPLGSVLGLNYSGMHDSAIAIVGPNGAPLFACALERLSRVKQDGSPPFLLLEGIPWERIAKVAISTDQSFTYPSRAESKLLEVSLVSARTEGLRHEEGFHDFLLAIPVEKEFVCHQMAHAASAFWASGFETALCLTYDGGMGNSPWFGGLYLADRRQGLRALDQFSALHYAKVTSLYTFVTALLGFTPNKHEGKITGLAAYGAPSDACRQLLHEWFENDYLGMESSMEWVFTHRMDVAPMLRVNEARMQGYRLQAQAFSREELAATVQEFAETHVLQLLARARAMGWHSENICLAGGLFANVKINQKVVESGFRHLYVAPPMTDDGTALGAAWHALSNQQDFSPPKLQTMYLGNRYSAGDMEVFLNGEGIRFSKPARPEEVVAGLLAEGQVVAVFQGAMEFGPRALGNRSILASAVAHDINQSLNKRLDRTEFMPFAPVSRVEDAPRCYRNIDHVLEAAWFMTVTVDCTDEMKVLCPAVVHIDGTARPQLVSQQSNPFVHAVLSSYAEKTGRYALVNTSFNIHEEPIVCSPEDALQGFLESGLDYLYLEGGYLIAFVDNPDAALKYARAKLRRPNQKAKALTALVAMQDLKLADYELQLNAKEAAIKQLKLASADVANYQKLMAEQARALKAYQLAYGGFTLLRPLARLIRRASEIIRPRLGNLNQYAPRALTPTAQRADRKLDQYPLFSIATPSFQQGNFIEKTLCSVLDQSYPRLEFFVQDGGSTDSTVDVLKQYETRLAGWVSEKDGGQSQAINAGLAKTTGDIMAWLNSDDLLLPGALHAVADYLNRHPDVDVVYGNRLLIDENDMEIGRWIMPGHNNAVLSWADFVPQETMFWRRRIWDKVGGRVDESFRFAMDWDLLVRFREAGARFAHIPEFLGAFRIHQHQKTSASLDDLGHQEMDRIRKRILGRVPSRKEIRAAIFPYLLKHLAFDMLYRLKVRMKVNA